MFHTATVRPKQLEGRYFILEMQHWAIFPSDYLVAPLGDAGVWIFGPPPLIELNVRFFFTDCNR